MSLDPSLYTPQLNKIISHKQIENILKNDREREFSKDCSFPLSRIENLESFRTKMHINQIVKKGMETVKKLTEERTELGENLKNSKENSARLKIKLMQHKRIIIQNKAEKKLAHAKKMYSAKNREYHGTGISGLIFSLSIIGLPLGAPLLIASEKINDCKFYWEKEVWILENAPESVEYCEVRKMAKKIIVEFHKNIGRIEQENSNNKKLMQTLWKAEENNLKDKKRELKDFINKHVYNS